MSSTVNLSGEHVTIIVDDVVLLDMAPQGHIEIEYHETQVFGVGFGDSPSKMVHVVTRQPMACNVTLYDNDAGMAPPDQDAIMIVAPEQWADIIQCKVLRWYTSSSVAPIEDPASMWRIVAPEHRAHTKLPPSADGKIRLGRTYFTALRGQS